MFDTSEDDIFAPEQSQTSCSETDTLILQKNEKNAFSPDQSFSFQRILAQKYVYFPNQLSLRWRFVGGCILACSTP